VNHIQARAKSFLQEEEEERVAARQRALANKIQNANSCDGQSTWNATPLHRSAGATKRRFQQPPLEENTPFRMTPDQPKFPRGFRGLGGPVPAHGLTHSRNEEGVRSFL